MAKEISNEQLADQVLASVLFVNKHNDLFDDEMVRSVVRISDPAAPHTGTVVMQSSYPRKALNAIALCSNQRYHSKTNRLLNIETTYVSGAKAASILNRQVSDFYTEPDDILTTSMPLE